MHKYWQSCTTMTAVMRPQLPSNIQLNPSTHKSTDFKSEPSSRYNQYTTNIYSNPMFTDNDKSNRSQCQSSQNRQSYLSD